MRSCLFSRFVKKRTMMIVKKILAIYLCLIFVILLCSCAQKRSEPSTTEALFLEEYQQYVDKLVNNEEKVYSQATLEDKFADNKIIIVVKHYYSLKFKEYKPSDFLPVKVADVEDLTYGTGQMVKAKMTGKNYYRNDGSCVTPEENNSKVYTFNQMLVITLAEPGKENVLAAIEILEEFDEFKSVSVDGVY